MNRLIHSFWGHADFLIDPMSLANTLKVTAAFALALGLGFDGVAAPPPEAVELPGFGLASMLDAAQLVHLGYALMLCALCARDVLWLRAILVAAQSTLTAYAWFTDRPSMAAWNALFVVINTLWVLRILRERRAVELPPPLRAIHQQSFSAFSPPEFLRFWNLGKTLEATDALLVRLGERPESLLFLVAGQVQVMQADRQLAVLGPGSFIGEMSLVVDALASADVRAASRVELQAWPMDALRRLRTSQPQLWPRLQSAIGQDLVEKIRRQSLSG